MAERLSNTFGTNDDKVNCPFFFKNGACRYGDQCIRRHIKPTSSRTLLFAHMYTNPPHAIALAEGHAIPEEDILKVVEDFEKFYMEVYLEIGSFGEIEEMHVMDNLGEHMIGNVYVRFVSEEDAENAIKNLAGRYYMNKLVMPEYSQVINFDEGKCRQFETSTCKRGAACNFMHLKPVSRDLLRALYKQMHKDNPKYKERRRNDKKKRRDRDDDEDRYRERKRRRRDRSESVSESRERRKRKKDKSKKHKKEKKSKSSRRDREEDGDSRRKRSRERRRSDEFNKDRKDDDRDRRRKDRSIDRDKHSEEYSKDRREYENKDYNKPNPELKPQQQPNENKPLDSNLLEKKADPLVRTSQDILNNNNNRELIDNIKEDPQLSVQESKNQPEHGKKQDSIQEGQGGTERQELEDRLKNRLNNNNKKLNLDDLKEDVLGRDV